MHEVITLIVLQRPILGQTICTTRHGKQISSPKNISLKIIKSLRTIFQLIMTEFCDVTDVTREEKNLLMLMKRRQHYFGFRAQIYIKTFNCKNISTKASHLFTEIIFHKYVHLFSVQGPCVVLMPLWSFYICMYISGLSHFSDPFILKSPLVNIRQSLTCPFAEGQIPVITNNCNIIIKQYPLYYISI